MIYALPYFALVCFYMGLAALFHRAEDWEKRMYIEIACVSVFIFFFGFRGYILFDWYAYYPQFHAQPDFRTLFTQDISKWDSNPGFVVLMVAVKSIYPNFHFFTFVCTCINTVLLVRFLKKYSDNMPLSFALILSINGISIFTDLMRNSISMLLFLNSLQYLSERKPLPYFAINLLGFTFHTTAILYFPLYFILHLKYNKWFLLSLFLTSSTIYLLHIPILKTLISLVADVVAPSTKYWLEFYLTFDTDSGFTASIVDCERILTCLLMFLFIERIRAIRVGNDIFINSLFLAIILYFAFGEFTTVRTRLSMLFCYGYWIIWADLLKCFEFKNNRQLFAMFIGLFCLLKVYITCNMQLAEYENILFSARPYNERLILFRQHFNDER